MTRSNTTPRRSRVRQAATARRLLAEVREMTVIQGIYPPHIEASTLVDPNIRQHVMRSRCLEGFRVGAVEVEPGEHFYQVRFKDSHRYFVMVRRNGTWFCSLPDPEYIKTFIPRIERYRRCLLAHKAA